MPSKSRGAPSKSSQQDPQRASSSKRTRPGTGTAPNSRNSNPSQSLKTHSNGSKPSSRQSRPEGNQAENEVRVSSKDRSSHPHRSHSNGKSPAYPENFGDFQKVKAQLNQTMRLSNNTSHIAPAGNQFLNLNVTQNFASPIMTG